MAKFATKAKATSRRSRIKTVNHEGHPAYQKTAAEELYSAVVASFLNGDKFYETEEETMSRIRQLVDELVADNQEQFLIGLTYLVRKLGNRTAFHYLSALVGQAVETQPHAVKNMFQFGIERADDLTEIAAAWATTFGKIEKRSKGSAEYPFPSLRGIPRRVREGLQRAFTKFDAYQLAKYKSASKSVKLRDTVCVCHPNPEISKAGKESYKQLLDGTIATPETWEAKVSAAGTDVAAKKAAWESLLKEGKMGYMAMLRNLRNFIEAGIDKKLFLPTLTDKERVLKSKQFPFRFLSAYKAVEEMGGTQQKTTLKAIEAAIGHACQNIPEMDGATVVAVDLSGSMTSRVSQKSTLTMMEIGANFGSMLYERSDEVITYGFGHTIKQIGMSPTSGVLTNAQKITNTDVGHSTNGYLVVENILRKNINAERVVFFTDCQLWDSDDIWGDGNRTHKAVKNYWKKVNSKTHFWFVDLQGYSTTIDPGDARIHLIAGFNENILKMIPRGEESLNISEDIINLCKDIYAKLNKGEYPGRVRELFEEMV